MMSLVKKSNLFFFLKKKIKSNKLSKLLETIIPKITCIDIGASKFVHIKWLYFLNSKNTTWIAAEPFDNDLSYQKKWVWDAHLKTYENAFHNKSGIKKFFITNIPTGSSLKKINIHPSMKHRVNQNYIYPLKEKNIKTISLKKIIEKIQTPVFLKIDTQGTEYEILKNIKDEIKKKKILGLEVESSLLAKPNHVDGSKFHKIQEYMEKNKYELIELKVIKFRSNQINKNNNNIPNECDAVFVPRLDIILKMNLKSQILVLVFYLCYNLNFESLNLINTSKQLNSFLKRKNLHKFLEKELIKFI